MSQSRREIIFFILEQNGKLTKTSLLSMVRERLKSSNKMSCDRYTIFELDKLIKEKIIIRKARFYQINNEEIK